MDKKMDSPSTETLSAHDGIALACEVGGSGDSLLLFVHGWTCRRDYWLPQLRHFSSDYRVAAPDLPGHGATPAQGRSNWSISGLGKDIASCVQQLDAPKTILIGHSMGGAVALEAAREPGNTLSAVILVDTFVIDYGGLNAEAIREIAEPFAADFQGAIASLVRQTSTDKTPEPLKERLIREMSAADPACALPLWQDLLSWNPMPAFEDVSIPVHAINGALIPESARNRCAPFVKESVISGAGHFLQMEDPAGFNRRLEQVLDTL
jgi:pimeloyl-ACP methyl ester carboxylesterase